MDRGLGYLFASDFLEILRGQIAVINSDFNVPFIDGRVADDFRVRQAVP